MYTFLQQFAPPTFFAHRGAKLHAPENTLASFQLAVDQGAPAIELDAKLTKDGEVVVIHDHTVDRTTQGSGRVNQLTLAEIRRLDAGSFFDERFRGEPVPTLDEVFAAVGQQTYINVELTNYTSIFDPLAEKVAALVKKHRLEERVLFSTFDINLRTLWRIKRYIPQAPVGLLASTGWMGGWARGFLGRLLINYQALHPELGDVSAKLVQESHRHGKRVHVFTVNKPEDMRRLFAFGVDAIFTDSPPAALEVLRERQALPANS